MAEKSDYEKSYDVALNIWDNLTDVQKDPKFLFQTKLCPMHPFNFFTLSKIKGFNNLNGATYEEYVQIWRNPLRRPPP